MPQGMVLELIMGIKKIEDIFDLNDIEINYF
jgi:hypothetical protein